MVPERRSGLTSTALLCLLALAGCGLLEPDEPPGPPVPEGAALVARVEEAGVDLVGGDPPSVTIRATGSVAGTGWTNARLVPANRGQPFDGLYAFSLVADPPAAPGVDAVEAVEASATLNPAPAGITGVRILAGRNSMVRLLGVRPYGNQSPAELPPVPETGVELPPLPDAIGASRRH